MSNTSLQKNTLPALIYRLSLLGENLERLQLSFPKTKHQGKMLSSPVLDMPKLKQFSFGINCGNFYSDIEGFLINSIKFNKKY